MRISALVLGALAAAVVLVARDAFGQAGTPPPRPGLAAPSQQSIEEMTVLGRRALNRLALDVRAAKEHVYEVFNKYNSDDDLDIYCFDVRHYMSHLRERQCRPVYTDEATAQAGAEFANYVFFNCGSTQPNKLGLLQECSEGELANASAQAQPYYGKIQVMNKRLDAEVQRLARENPDVAQAIADYFAKEREYQDAARRAKSKE